MGKRCFLFIGKSSLGAKYESSQAFPSPTSFSLSPVYTPHLLFPAWKCASYSKSRATESTRASERGRNLAPDFSSSAQRSIRELDIQNDHHIHEIWICSLKLPKTYMQKSPCVIIHLRGDLYGSGPLEISIQSRNG